MCQPSITGLSGYQSGLPHPLLVFPGSQVLMLSIFSSLFFHLLMKEQGRASLLKGESAKLTRTHRLTCLGYDML